MSGRSTAPRLIFTSKALALPLVTLSSIAFTGSSSPSNALLTTNEIKSS